MSAWLWATFGLAAIVYSAVSITRTWRRERALTAQCQADEQAKTEALMRQITEGRS